MFNFSRRALLALSLATLTSAVDIPVTVGGADGSLTFSPNQVTAAVGDRLLFEMRARNHSITQSSLQNPCSPLEGGFDSGFIPVPVDQTTDFPVRGLEIRTTDPYWICCKQGNHCSGSGMVFAVNPGNNFDAFLAAATGGAAPTSTAPATTAPTGVVTVTATVTVNNGGQVITTTYGSYPGSAQPTAAAPNVHVITVGGPGILTFQPSNISAQVGDEIRFTFNVKNHSATQSSFGQPCQPLAQSSSNGQVGFDSGFNPVGADVTDNFPTFNVTVNDTAPIWVFCRQGNHCASGMVFSANAIESGPNNFEAFRQKAIGQNGTNNGTNGGGNGSGGNGAASLSVNYSAVLSLGLVAAVFSVLL